jgi:hypothetical protein
MKACDKYHSETRDCSRTGLSYVVNFYYDADMTPPDVLNDGHGVVLDQDDYQSVQDSLAYAEEENTDEAVELRLRVDMMQRLDDQALRSWPRYYDVWMSLQKARKEQWNGADSTDHNALMAAVNADYDYLRGWYTADWWWAVIEVMPLDDEGEPMEQYAQGLGGLCSFDMTYNEAVVEELWQDCRKWMEIDSGAVHDQLSLPFD